MKRTSIIAKVRACSLAAASLAALVTATEAATPLADQPVFSATSVPGNLALALSVEWPTVSRAAHPSANYSSANIYRGYFDHDKCYSYVRVSPETSTNVSRFDPVGLAANRECTGQWSGNFLNWATMIAVDPFRWALTGGLRKVDEEGTTVLERARHSGQGSLFPDRTLSDATTISKATPFSWGTLKVRTQGAGTRLVFSSTGNLGDTPVSYVAPFDSTKVYRVQVRVKVCDPAFPESNCKRYSATNWKPEGLIQEYSDRMRYSAFGYLNDSSMLRDGGVLRARQKFVGPTMPVPGSPDVSNPRPEWSATTGVFYSNPEATDAAATVPAVSNSGVINYLNKFGQLTTNDHKSYDPVSELFYAVTRYFRNLGNVGAWTAMGADTAANERFVDGFPVITNWDDPIQYSCQRNFVLGIGDIYTHRDKNLPGSGTGTADEPTKPGEVSSDTAVDSVTYTTKAFAKQGLGTPGVDNYSGRNNSAGMVGLAYHANTQDLRTDLPGKQTLSTYWVDVLEAPFVANNQFYLAAKYGGFNVPTTFDALANNDPLDETWWYTTTRTEGATKLPDNYFTAGQPDDMIKGLRSAFARIAAQLTAFTTSFSSSLPQVAATDVASYATQFDAKSWTGELTTNSSEMDAATGEPTQTEKWRFSAKLAAQAAGTGWDTGRRIVTFNTATNLGVPFRTADISVAQQTALDTTYRSGDDSADYLNYLRGDRTHEKSSTATTTSKAYRDRSSLLGDIVGSKAKPVGPPAAPFSAATNPGYSAFKTTYKDRKTMVYVGTNQGMLHAVDGSPTGANAGQEVFAYVPGALYAGSRGLKVLGDPTFVHYPFVDATPAVADVDFGKTDGSSGTDWRTILVGGLGKGGKSVYAIDVTDPASMTSEAVVAGKVLWEFSHADLGHSYGEPAIVKTKKYGWVVIFGSGYNNTDGQGYFFIVNPKTGALLAKVGTGAGSSSDDAGLAHVQAFLPDRTDGTADTVYAGDLLGNLWRLDVSGTAAYAAPTKMASLTSAGGGALPVTSRPLIVVHPQSNKRYVTVGTGRLLHSSDLGSTQAQRYFAILDGTNGRFNKSSDLPSGISFPITTANLKELTDLTQKVTFDYATEIGWFVDLGSAADGRGWRVISDSTSFLGTVAFPAMVPAGASACESSGKSRIYAIDLGSGQSRLRSGNNVVATLAPETTGVVTDLRFYSVAGKPRLLAGYDTGKNKPVEGEWVSPPILRRLNWREVPLAD